MIHGCRRIPLIPINSSFRLQHKHTIFYFLVIPVIPSPKLDKLISTLLKWSIVSSGSGSGDGDATDEKSQAKKDKTDVVYGQEGKGTTGASSNKYEYEYTNPDYDNGKPFRITMLDFYNP